MTSTDLPHPDMTRGDWRQLEPRPRVGLAVIITLAFAACWPSLGGGFVWDDLILVLKNPLVMGEKNLFNIWFTEDFSLTTVATWFEWLLFGKTPLGYRVINVLLHSASALLLWRVIAHLKLPGAWLASVIFIVHPMCVASVAWISELKNTLSLPLFLASIHFFLKTELPGTESEQPKARQTRDYAFSILCFALGLMAKTSTVMLPVLLLLLMWWKRGHITRRDILKTLPHFVLAIVFGLLTIWFQTHQAIRTVVPQQENILERFPAAAMAVWFYLGKAFVPLNHCMIYPRWEIDGLSITNLLPLLALLTAIIALWLLKKKWPIARTVWFTLAAFTVLLFPVLGFFDMYYMVFSRVSDHLAYLPLVTLVPIIAAICLRPSNANVRLVIAALVVCTLLFLSFQRSHAFRSDESLWRDTVAKNPAAWNAHNNLACNLAERGDLSAAMEHFARSLEINPKNASAQRNYAKALTMKRRFTEADEHYRAALALKPADAGTLTDYAEMLAQDGRLTEAAELYHAALDIAPKLETRLRLAPLLAVTGQGAAAVKQFRLVLAEQPDSIEALNNLAWMLATSADASLRDGHEAVQFAEKAWKLTNGKEATALGTLAAAYAEAGQFTNAIIASGQAISLAQATGNTRYVQLNQHLQQLYRAGRPYHEPTRGGK